LYNLKSVACRQELMSSVLMAVFLSDMLIHNYIRHENGQWRNFPLDQSWASILFAHVCGWSVMLTSV
jgi:hypothetical protein